ncbi:MAG: formylglycine-generating enzyme family protein [Deltaproteobacteria bacterium]|nr:formylglycine-generating enzyme family protein [Deltaproteobacteria bacterium]
MERPLLVLALFGLPACGGASTQPAVYALIEDAIEEQVEQAAAARPTEQEVEAAQELRRQLGLPLAGGPEAPEVPASPEAPETPDTSEPPQPSADCPSGMARIPAGSFMMGSEDGEPDERRVHEVPVQRFCMDLTEVTVDAYGACVNAGSCTKPDAGADCNWGESWGADRPVNCVDWNQAIAYCAWAEKRLPTEEEWEYAARGTDGRKYPWGKEEPAGQLCWEGVGNDLGRDNPYSTCPVGRYAAGRSPFGLFDMAGNVWEWTASWYSEDYGKSGVTANRVSRGGGRGQLASDVRAAIRWGHEPTYRSHALGFRCAR